MSEAFNFVNRAIDEEHRDKSAHTRRQMIRGAGAVLGGVGLMGLASGDALAQGFGNSPNTPENITTVAATAEVLATIVNTVGPERVALDDVTKRNIQAAAIEEKIHYKTLISDAVGATPATKRIWVPNGCSPARRACSPRWSWAIRSSSTPTSSASPPSRAPATSRVAIRALRGRIHGRRGGTPRARAAVARQARQRPRVHALRRTRGDARPPDHGSDGFYDIREAVAQLEAAGFGFGKEGSKAGQFYEYDEVSRTDAGPGLPDGQHA